MVKDLKPSCPWISRHSIDFACTKYGKNEAATQTDSSSASASTLYGVKPVSRPSGSTNDTKYGLKLRREMSLDAIAVEFHEMGHIVKRDGKYVKKGCLDNMIIS